MLSAADSRFSSLPHKESLEKNKVRSSLILNCVFVSPSRMQAEPEQVLPWLFLGCAEHAASSACLRALGVTALLNVSTTQLAQLDGFVYMHIPVADSCGSDLAIWFTDAIQFIGQLLLIFKRVVPKGVTTRLV